MSSGYYIFIITFVYKILISVMLLICILFTGYLQDRESIQATGDSAAANKTDPVVSLDQLDGMLLVVSESVHLNPETSGHSFVKFL